MRRSGTPRISTVGSSTAATRNMPTKGSHAAQGI
nr:MAG TPA: hypothetical protein [Caudoviricetes sp.]